MSTVGTKCINTLIDPFFNLHYTTFTETSVCFNVKVSYSFGTLKEGGISSVGGISFLMISISALVSTVFSYSQPDLGSSHREIRSVRSCILK